MTQNEAPLVAKAVALHLRALHGGTREAFARDSGVSLSTIRLCEQGARSVRRTTLDRMAAAAAVRQPELDVLLAVTRAIVEHKQGGSRPWAAGALEAASYLLMQGLADLTLEAAQLLTGRLARLADPEPGWAPVPPAAADRREAPALLARLERYEHRDRLFLIEEVEGFQTWSLAELLCEKSLAEAADGPGAAVELAEQAVLVAELIQGDDRWRARILGYCLTHLGNALRVRNSLAEAEKAFARGLPLWREGAAAGPGLLNEAQVLGLEASLHRDQRRFGRALDLLGKALKVDRGELRTHLLINQAKTLKDLGELERAVAALHQAKPLLDPEREPRLAFIARLNRAYYLSLLNRFEEAGGELEELAERGAKKLDLLRLAWVRGRVAAGLGREEEGLAALEQVQRDFKVLDMPYDWALVTLEIAVLHLEKGRTREVQALAREMLPVFQSQEIHREAMAALTLFHRAAEQERATAELARRVAAYLHRARNNPELRFED